MEITRGLLEKIYKRTNEYCKIKYHIEPHTIEIEDGYILAFYKDHLCGGGETYNISPEELTRDLDEVYEERKKAEAEAEREKEIQRKKEREEREKREREKRHKQYMKLKEEFGNE